MARIRRAPVRAPVRLSRPARGGGGWTSAAPTTRPIAPVRRPKRQPGGWVSAGPGTRPITGPIKPPKPPSWAIGAPLPRNPTLTPTQQSALAQGFQQYGAYQAGDYSAYDGGSDGGGGYGGGGSYDINTDPGVIQARAQEAAATQQLDADLAKSRREAIIRFGDPALASLAGFGLDPTDVAAAKQNYLAGNADLARLDKGHQDRRRMVINALAARGIVGSGELGYEQGQEDLTYGQQTYDARSKVLDYLNQVNQQYLDRKQSARQATLAALQSAYQFGLSNPYMYGEGGGGAGGGGGDGGGGGGDWTYQLQGRSTEYDPNAAYSQAAASAPTYGGTQFVPHMIMNEGQTFTDANGRRYINVKYTDPTGRAGSSTERVYVG